MACTHSQAIKELEDELGYSILLRHKKGGVEFTPQGLWVLEKAHIIIGTLDDLENSKTLFSQRSSVVKIAAPPFILQFFNSLTDGRLGYQ